jgi:hypothetical protein
MAFSYNTSLHRAIKATPYFLTYGLQARMPNFPGPDLQPSYGEDPASEHLQRLQLCRQAAAGQLLQYTDKTEQQYNKNSAPHKYVLGQLVWLDIQNFLGKNRKLAPKWEGPYLLTRIFENGVVDLQRKNRVIRVNMARIKPFVQGNNFQRPTLSPATAPPSFALQTPPDTPPPQPEFVTLQPQEEEQSEQQPAVTLPQRRGRGRPRKVNQNETPAGTPPATEISQPAMAAQNPGNNDPTVSVEARLTRAQARAMERAGLPAPVFHSLVNQINSECFKMCALQTYDEYGIPTHPPKNKIDYYKRRRVFLKKLSPAQRNTLLTGDPLFAFDPVLYAEIATTAHPEKFRRLIQRQFDYFFPHGQLPAYEYPEQPAEVTPPSTRSASPAPSPPRSPASSDGEYINWDTLEEPSSNESPGSSPPGSLYFTPKKPFNAIEFRVQQPEPSSSSSSQPSSLESQPSDSEKAATLPRTKKEKEDIDQTSVLFTRLGTQEFPGGKFLRSKQAASTPARPLSWPVPEDSHMEWSPIRAPRLSPVRPGIPVPPQVRFGEPPKVTTPKQPNPFPSMSPQGHSPKPVFGQKASFGQLPTPTFASVAQGASALPRQSSSTSRPIPLMTGMLPWVKLKDAHLSGIPPLVFIDAKKNPPPGYIAYTGPLPSPSTLTTNPMKKTRLSDLSKVFKRTKK